MARVIVLDSGPLGTACGRRGRPEVDDITFWLIQAKANGVLVVIAEVADYEVRRGLTKAGARDGVTRLDALCGEYSYAPISTAAMRRAASLWAEARARGLPTAGERTLDGDAILAAQALEYAGLGDELVVATDNARHLSRFPVDARPWDQITP
jgi:predicted nucleic acid-binding protein